MASYSFEAGGKTYAFDAPDDMSPDEAYAQAQEMLPKSVFDRFEGHLSRLTAGMADPLFAGAQGLRNAVEAVAPPVRKAVDQADPWLYRNTGGVLGHQDQNLNKTIQDREIAYQANQAPEGFDWMRTAGNVIGSAPLALMEAPGLLGAAGVGAASGLVTPVFKQDQADDLVSYAKEKVMQGAAGAGTGAALHAVLSPLLGGMTPQKGLEDLRAAGVNPTVGQAMGGMLDTLEQKAQSMPIVGDSIRAARQAARDEFNTATINKVLEPIGQRVSGEGTTAVKAAQNAIDDAYGMAKGKINSFSPDYVGAARSDVLRTMNQAGLNEFAGIVSNLTNGAETLTAQGYKVLDSDLANLIGKYQASSSAQDKLVGDALKNFRINLKDQLIKSSPELGDLMRSADKAHAGMVRVDKAANAAGLQGGVFTPGQLVNSVKSSDRSARKQAFAAGDSMLQDWAVNAQKILGDKYPDSGTPGRILGMGGTAAGLAHYEPHALAGMVLASAGAHPKVQSALIDLLTRNPGVATEILTKLLPLTSGSVDRELGRGKR